MTLLRSVLMPCARLMTGLQPVARMPQPSSVPKNRYSTATTSTAAMASTTSAPGTSIWLRRTWLSRTDRP